MYRSCCSNCSSETSELNLYGPTSSPPFSSRHPKPIMYNINELYDQHTFEVVQDFWPAHERIVDPIFAWNLEFSSLTQPRCPLKRGLAKRLHSSAFDLFDELKDARHKQLQGLSHTFIGRRPHIRICLLLLNKRLQQCRRYLTRNGSSLTSDKLSRTTAEE
jgi:hypothetical protein